MTSSSTQTVSPHFGQDATARTYSQIHLPRVFAPWARILVEIVPPRPGEHVLDAATGPGTVAREAAALVGSAGRVVGVDVSAAMLAVGRTWPADQQAASAPIEYLECSASSLPLPDASFDVAYCQQGLQHMTDPMAALRELRRVLKPGGRLGVAIWARSPFGLFRDVVAQAGLPGGGGPQPSAFGREPAALEAALREAGFGSVGVQTRELVSVLEGGIPQALEVAIATSAGAMLATFTPEQQAAIRETLAAALQPYVKDGAVHLPSAANIAAAA